MVAGSVALGRDDGNHAATLFTEALSLNASDGRSWAGLGMASLLNNDLAEAKQQLERAAAKMPTHIGTLHALGWCQILRRELPGAQDSFGKGQSTLDLRRSSQAAPRPQSNRPRRFS